MTRQAIWRSGSRFNNIAPEAALAELEDIKAMTGGDLTPAAVVDRAANDDNVLHKAFDWDDESVAEKHRLATARNLIRSIQIIPAEKTEASAVAVYHNVVAATGEEDKPRKVYRDIDEIMADPIARSELLRSSINEIMRFRRRYDALQELSQIHAAIDATLTSDDILREG